MPRTSKQRIDRNCDYCTGRNTVLRRQVSRNSADLFLWYCLDCGKHAKRSNIWIGHKTVAGWMETGLLKITSFDEIPVVKDYTNDPEFKCIVCGQPGVEYNHWAPQALAEQFGEDWYQWPGDYLCKYHHDLWHEVVTPYLPGRGRTKEAQAVIARYMEIAS